MTKKTTLPSIDPEVYAKKAGAFLERTLSHAGYSRVVVGVSGGVDSAVTLTLCAQALGKRNVHAILLPYGKDAAALSRARTHIKRIGIAPKNVLQIDIRPIVDSITMQTHATGKLRRGNSMARTRMIALYDCAQALSALVVGTENKSEYLLGYFTRFGDEASDIELIRPLYKTQVYTLARHLGVSTPILTASPSAGLWQGQTDEAELGFSYRDADRVLYLCHDRSFSQDQIVCTGLSRTLVRRVLSRVRRNDFKHRAPHVFLYPTRQ